MELNRHNLGHLHATNIAEEQNMVLIFSAHISFNITIGALKFRMKANINKQQYLCVPATLFCLSSCYLKCELTEYVFSLPVWSL
jgi:hypothetical protein